MKLLSNLQLGQARLICIYPPPRPLPSPHLLVPAEGDAGGAVTNSHDAKIFRHAVAGLSSAEWWSARACVTHARLLLSTSFRSDTLWTEALGLFSRAVGLFGGGVVVVAGEAGAIGEAGRVRGEDEEAVSRRVAAQVWLEWGLAQHHFQVCVAFAVVGVLFVRKARSQHPRRSST